jgi:hypothetical protein
MTHKASFVMPLQPLKLGDRIHIVRLPPEWKAPGYHVPRSTRDLYRRLMARKRPLVINEIDELGLPWIQCRFRDRGGRMVYHFLVIDDGCWVRVRARADRSSLRMSI